MGHGSRTSVEAVAIERDGDLEMIRILIATGTLPQVAILEF